MRIDIDNSEELIPAAPANRAAKRASDLPEGRFSDLVTLSHEWIWETDENGNFSFSGPQVVNLLGFAENEIIGRNPCDLMPPARAIPMPPELAFRGRAPIEFANEKRIFVTRTGGVVTLEASGLPFFEKNGTWAGYRGVCRKVPRVGRQGEKSENLLAEALVRASHDSLTGLWNRRAFQERLEEEIYRAHHSGRNFSVVLADVDNFKFFNEAYGHLAGDDVLRMIGDEVRSRCRSGDAVARLGGDEFAVLLPGLNRKETEVRMTALCASFVESGYTPSGQSVAVPVGISCGVAAWPQDSAHNAAHAAHGVSDTATSLLLRADERLYKNKTSGRDMWSTTLRDDWKHDIPGFEVLDSLIVAVHIRDRYTLRHSEDVLIYSILMAQEAGLAATEIETLKLAAFLHDTGMIGVPERLLRRPGALTVEEFAAIKLHPAMGAAIVSTVHALEPVLPAIQSHHERWDGGGYPAGLSGGDIPFAARILAVADAFSAMTTDRPFRRGRPIAEAADVLRAGSGNQWDPDCVGAFLRAYFG